MSLDGGMTHDSWAASDDGGLPQNQHNPHPPPPPGTATMGPVSGAAVGADAATIDEPLDRQLLRLLMEKYTPDRLDRMMQEEKALALSHAETASVITSSTYSSVRSDDAPSIFDSASSTRTLSDTSSARGSIISNVSARTAKFLSRKSHIGQADRAVTSAASQQPGGQTTEAAPPPSLHGEDDEGTPVDSASALTTNAAKQKGTFMCGFCKEEGIRKTCTRKNDLKRHIEDFHSMNALWFCSQQGCGMIFDWPTVYKTHLKRAHGGSRMVADEAKVTLCPQTVFACGFDNCIQVFESPSDADAPATFKEYVAHVVKHLDEGSNSGEWTYTTRMRNLMRQSAILNAWVGSYSEADRERLDWQPQTTGILRKRLETKHLGDLHLLIQYAYALGSGAQVPDMRENLAMPVRDECQMQIPGHQTRRPLQAPPQPTPLPQHMRHPHQPQQPQQQPPEAADQFSFKISRGANPHLAHYYASQRRVFPAKPPVRAGRSARPPMHTLPTTPMAPHQPFHQQQQQQQQQQQAMFDPSGMWAPHQQQHHHHHPQQYHQQLMSPADSGIIADDLRSLRSMASSNTASSTDVDMADAQMMDSSSAAYMAPPPAQDYSAPPYAAGGLQSPPSSDGCIKMEQQDPFAAYESQNGY